MTTTVDKSSPLQKPQLISTDQPPLKKQRTVSDLNQVDQLKQLTTVVADTGDVNAIKSFLLKMRPLTRRSSTRLP